ncbi:MAG TPA: hypothetical protein VI386_14015, partial [Candidatus Sulfotelmatobacter sp.]
MTNRLSFAAVVIFGATILFGNAEAKSKTNPAVDVNIPFSFQLGHRTLPAGDYKFELVTGEATADSMGVLVVRNQEAKIYQSLAVPVRAGLGLSSESRVVFGGGD